MSGYATMLQNGITSVNEVRDLENWNPIEGGDEHHIQLNMQPLTPSTEEPPPTEKPPADTPPPAVESAALYRIEAKRFVA